jgi:hypothetical protein
MQAFAANESSIHFDTLQGSVAMYGRTMDIWRRNERLFPLKLQYTRYESLVANPEAEIQSVCTFLGREPVAAMFDPETRLSGRETVRTPSYHQVAEPLYQRSVGRWVNYRAQLAPYLEALRPLAEHFGYQVDDA